MSKLANRWLGVVLALASAGAEAQTMASSGATGTVGNVHYISSGSSTSTTLNSSRISISGGNVGAIFSLPHRHLATR